MAKLLSNKAVGDLQGKVGGLVYVHRADGEVIVRRSPERHADSAGQPTLTQVRFAGGTRYVRRLKANPELYAPYHVAARIQRKRACDLAMSDFLSAPVVQDVDLAKYHGNAGELIGVQAVDDFGVGLVSLTITHLDGALIEQGDAVRGEQALVWTYTTQAPVAPGETVILRVMVMDKPGNVVSKTFHHALLPV